MRLSKDEAFVLSVALGEDKYRINDKIRHWAEEKGIDSLTAFDALESKLLEFSKDKRRLGRRSQDSLVDKLKRFVRG